MTNIIVIAVVAAILGAAIWYIRKEKRQGAHCVGCPHTASCGSKCSSCSGCCGKCSEE